jgi:histidinol phosphatase-like enzyme (inositol monophosphatase family)
MIADLLAAADNFAKEAGAVTLRYFGGRIEHETKADGTPVTLADREAERLIRRRISERFPDHGILGEEDGETRPGAAVRWIVDPIDGTLSFMRGVPLYGVLLGIEVDGAPAVGVAHFPALSETVSAGRGLGCRWNGRPCRVSDVDDVRRALVLTTDPRAITDGPVGSGWRALLGAAALVRTWGDCYGHALVATGRADVMVDPVLSSWDAAPLLTILTEAGGRFTDLDGNESIHGGSGVSSSGKLHEEVLGLLRG